MEARLEKIKAKKKAGKRRKVERKEEITKLISHLECKILGKRKRPTR